MTLTDYIKWLWRAAEGLRSRIVLQAVVGVVHVAVSLFYVWVCKQLVDIATGRADGSMLLFIIIMASCIVAQILLSTYVSRMEVECEIINEKDNIPDTGWSTVRCSGNLYSKVP